MPDRDVILAVLQSGIALAGLLLIFAGFLLSKAGTTYNTRKGDIYKYLAWSTGLPVLVALAESWISIKAIEGSQWAGFFLLTGLRITIAFTAVFAIIGVIFAS